MESRSWQRIVDMWKALSTSDSAFDQPGVVIVAADRTWLSPPGWIGVVTLGDAAVVATPPLLLHRVEAALAAVDDPASVTSPAFIAARFGAIDEVRGPAVLAYGDVAPVVSGSVVGPVAADDPLVEQVLAASTPEEVDESGVTSADSGLFVALDDGRAVSAGSFREWPERIAHMSVLTAATHRGRGFGAAAASATFAAAAAAGYVFQWRAVETNAASRALAAKLGCEPKGIQLGFRI